MTKIDKSKVYVKYAKDVVAGKIVTGIAIKLACQRFLDWFDRNDIYFDYDDVDLRIGIIAKMKHTKGVFSGKNFILLPWQSWIVANIFGWKSIDSGLRVTQKAFILISRKNGKTALAAAIGLAASIGDKEAGFEVDFCANSREQAAIAFDATRDFVETLDPRRKLFKVLRRDITLPRMKGKINVMSSEALTSDGLNTSFGVIDEWHAARDYSTYDVMISSMGMRRQPIMFVISTAGFLVGDAYPCYATWKTCLDILKGHKEDDSMFSAIYQMDDDDDWKDEKKWIKASPSLGTTVTYEYMRGQIKGAQNQISLATGVKTKNLNMWVQSGKEWIPDTYLQDVTENVDINDYKDEEAYMGIDLSSTSDLTAVNIMFPPNPNRAKNPDKFVFITKLYVPEEATHKSSNDTLYREMVRQGHLCMTSGNVVDYDYILADILSYMKHCVVYTIGYDAWNSTQFAIQAEAEGAPLKPYSQSIGSYTRPTKCFERLVLSKQVVLDNNPMLRWCFSNVELKEDHNGNVKPVKANNVKSKKIDGVISVLTSLGVWLCSPRYNPRIISLNDEESKKEKK